MLIKGKGDILMWGQSIFKISLVRASQAQFAGTDEQVQGEQYRQLGQFPALLIVFNAFQQLRQTLPAADSGNNISLTKRLR
ncbi:hypothetical protein AU509_15425 [Lonsdalea britannica]|uniref:Uncharacterized protein n=2 Tax=Lonsdalea britannica TaxID=1082704 RepID=A0AAD0WL96_9GAMM|nr:hypothetical protein CKQ53_11415 [Lonsdalea britannica]OSM94459.1 hypothetical protein AU509_15425 [Lonsdalea britannica]